MYATDHLQKLRAYDRWLNCTLTAVTLVVATLTYFCVFLPLGGGLQEVGTQTDALLELIQQTSVITGKTRELEGLLAKTEQENSELLQRIPTGPRESDFLTQVCQLANQMHLEVLEYHPGAVHPRENHHEMEVRLVTHGEYESICRFLEQVEHLPRLCRLTQMDIGVATTKTKLSAEMTFRIYFAPPTEAESAKGG